ncbi:hypothetical protein EDB80DRAFT_759811 [Ilyonectria destructans]|nr:hypothetical protein EDB80DRAFT_759811 [Ilyonectria destructans]
MVVDLAHIKGIDLSAIDAAFLEGEPSTSRRDFKHPKLRQFPRRGSKIKWLAFLGSGREGMVFKVSINDGDPVALKVFWRAKRPTQPSPKGPGPMVLDWPFEDESITAALLQMMQCTMADDDTKAANGANRTITIKNEPKTAAEAKENLCIVDDVDWHWAIIYEFVPGKDQDTDIGQRHLSFFHSVGFALGPYKCDNWHGGRLIDLNDIRTPYGIGWMKSSVRHRDAKTWFSTLGPKKAGRRRNV